MSHRTKLLSLFALTSAAFAVVLPRISVLPPAFGTSGAITKRDAQADYNQVFEGNAAGTPDASVEGAAYQTFTVINSNFYDIDSCLDFCNGVAGCVFANLYYEYNTDPSGPLLKCAVYSDVHTAADKLNQGGQQLLPSPAGLTRIEQSSGWVLKAFSPGDDPEGYELVFGPVDGANNAPGYMGFIALDSYDIDACAADCNSRGADAQGGACQYFNIWRAYTNGVVTGYTCSMYFEVADASTAVNYGQGDLKVTYSRGYRRLNLLTDGGFEGYTCTDFCFAESYANWVGTSTASGVQDATIFHYSSYAHTGTGVGLLGSATGADSNPGTLTPSGPLATVPGKTYEITFFLNTMFAGPVLEASASLQIKWNGATVQTITPGSEGWTFYQVSVTAAGNDQLAFFGGAAPAWIFIDDVSVFAA